MKTLKVIKLFTSVVVIGTLSLGTWAFAEVVINKEAPKESAGKVSEISSLVKGNSLAEPVTTVASASISLSGDMTLEELKNFNGQNGQPAYIAVKGIIYDVTKLGAWSNGTHNGYSSGIDLTDAFAKSPHAMSILSSASVVGNLVATTTPTTEVTRQNESIPKTIQNPVKVIDQAVLSQSYEDYDEDHDEDYDEDHDEDYDEDHDEDYDQDHDEDYDQDHDEDYDQDHDENSDEDHDKDNDEDYDENRDEDLGSNHDNERDDD